MSNTTVTGQITPAKKITGKVGGGRTIRGTFAMPKQYASSPLTMGTVFHKNIIRVLETPVATTSMEIEKVVS